MKKLLKSALLTLAAMLFAVSAYAQVTTSSISGKVTDQNGEALEGAVVVAVHNPSGTQYYAAVNKDGRYSINGMRPGGPYTVTVTLLGYNTKEINDISLVLGETAAVPAQLEESSMELAESIIVAEGGIDVSKTGAAAAYNSRQIQEMPSITRGIADVARLNPFLRTDNSGAMSFSGTNNRYNSFQIDGAMNNDVFGLTSNGSNGGQAGAQPVSMETIEQVQVNVAPFDIRQSGFTGGSINAITKSGTNEFHGSVYGFGNNQALYSPKYVNHDGSITDNPMTQQFQYQAGVVVGGRIVKDKLFFFASFERSDNQYPNSYGLGATASKVDANDAKAVLDWAKSHGYKGDLPSGINNYTSSNKATAKIDWNINNDNHFTFRWSLVDAKQLNQTSTATNLNSTDYMYDFVSKTNTFVAELQSRFSDNVSNELRASWVRVRDKRVPLGEPFPMISVAVTGGTVNIGNERSSEANRLDQDIWTIEDNLTWYAGNHTITFGTHDEFYTFTNLFIQDKYGTYYFKDVDALNAGSIKQYRYGHANTAIGLSENWEPTFHAGELGFYAQDKWALADNFDLTYGLRVDVPLFFDKPTENPSLPSSYEGKKWNVATNSVPKSTPLFSPRLGFRWNIANDGRYILRGGVGLFTGRIPFVWFSNNFSNTGVQLMTVNTSKADDLAKLTVITDPNGQGANEKALGLSAGSPASQVVNVVDKNFKIAQNLRADIGFDFKALGINWTIEGVFSKNINDVAYKTLTYEKDGGTVASKLGIGFDNRPTYKKAGEFNNIYYMTNTNKGYSYNLMVQAAKSFPFGLDVNASYTYTKSLSAFNSTSSVAASNFNYNYHHSDCNDPELANSAFNIPHQVKASVSYHVNYGRNDRWTTTLGLVYMGTSGAAYCIYYYGDINGDSSNGNDLIFIPTDEQIDQMPFIANSKFSVEQQRNNMKSWLGNEKYLKDHRGEYYDRYADNLPFESHFDFHFGQKLNFRVGQQVHGVELTVDFINIANLFNAAWGRSYGLGINQYYSPITYDSKSNAYQFLQNADYTMFSTSNILSRWRGQIGLKYSF
ncbi:MAG: TonB-dependent receptor [Bacteroidales bacterium]|nr:TonB-dependent receptor [Bacteroidales bacterium]